MTSVLSVSLALTAIAISPTTAKIPGDSIAPKSIAQITENSKLKPLIETEISQRLQALPNWTRDGKTIKYTHEFENFVQAVSFVNCLISPSEKAGHHPDIAIAYNRVTISLTTHDAGGLTKQDFELAETISKLVSEWMPGNVCLVVEGSG
ncbi:MAG: 4a-hydroxytetrahydrobiopterin dehydratase [Oscillatoriales cyanobacterium]|nr:MAG: 4a-hydroxytetrahydrobiopterin dehydratase [Oscillatoriales cyanobacterium]TAH23263.1 MAG: 4a-hydroxytetrahydrobiopterin dehydratase [Oscillatoriales cyanobacterium]